MVDRPGQALALWRIREDGAGLAGVSLVPAGVPRLGGRRGAAGPARRAICATSTRCCASTAWTGCPYGHFGDGCVHVRIDFPLTEPGGPGRYRTFVEQAAALVAGYGGSMSGEHGDGRARSALLPAMYSPAALELFGQVKAGFDPDNLLNPGVLVDPQPVDADLRTDRRWSGRLDHFAEAVHRCTGVGKCLADTTAGLGVMCPSYQATREEKDSTRGRARVLQEMINGDLVQLGWRSPAVHEALDLCLSCKGCARDCPTGIDMAAYKSEVLDRSYRGRLRPRSHYALGWLPRWGRLITRKPALARLVNLSTQTPGSAGWSAGAPASTSAGRCRDLPHGGPAPGRAAGRRDGRPVVVWVDSFSDCFTGRGVAAAVEVLAAAGYAPAFLERPACCGLTWISTGQLDGARRQLRAALDVLHPHVAAGHPGGRAGAVLHRGLAQRCRRTAARTIRGSPRSRRGV